MICDLRFVICGRASDGEIETWRCRTAVDVVGLPGPLRLSTAWGADGAEGRELVDYTDMTEEQASPGHHDPQGGFCNPWPRATQPVFTGMLRWAVTRSVKPRIDRTPRGSFPTATPDYQSPRAAIEDASLTWVGHATFLLQIGGRNVLTDPVWSEAFSV